MAAWVVVMEGQPKSGEGAVEVTQLRRLLEHMPGVEPIALHSAERVAVQVHVDAPCEVEALRMALADLRAGLPRVGLWDLRVVRAEVLTWEEFENDCRMADGESAASRAQEVADGVVVRAGDDLLRQAFQDPLTDLATPGWFMDQIERALLPQPGLPVEEHAIVVLKLTGLGSISESWGRSVADETLVTSAHRLRAALRPGATAGRIAGDEFAVLFGGLSEAQVEAIASRLVEALSQPVLIGDIEAALSPSAGIARSQPDQEAGDLVAQARAAGELRGRSRPRRPQSRVRSQASSGTRSEKPGHPAGVRPARLRRPGT